MGEGIVGVPHDKSPLIVNGAHQLYWFGMQGVEEEWEEFHWWGKQAAETPWSETRILTIPSGAMEDFESAQPKMTLPIDNQSLTSNGILEWTKINGADAYLVFIRYQNDYAVAVAWDTKISPPFPDNEDFVEGLGGLSAFQESVAYQVQVCALRLKSGAFGFGIQAPEGDGLPTIYTRYEHKGR